MRNRQQDIGCQMALVALVVVAVVAGIPPLVSVAEQWLAQSTIDAPRACHACGVVEDVREVQLGAATYGVSTISGEGIAMLFALLKGKLGTEPVKIYEVEVLLQDGSVRVVREATLPAWKPGDRVKLMMGQIRSVS
jgi:hypothetical protein